MNTRGAKTPRITPAMPGSNFQKHSMTWPKILRRRNSSACWYVGALESACCVEPWPTSTRAASEKSSFCTRHGKLNARDTASGPVVRAVLRDELKGMGHADLIVYIFDG